MAWAAFEHPEVTAKGETRASVPLMSLDTLWFNTGTRCNISCTHCYIESTPTNDRLVYLTRDDVAHHLTEIAELAVSDPARFGQVREIGFTGGEPFLNPHMLDLLEVSLAAGYEVLVLTNAMRPMQRGRIKEGLLALHQRYPGALTLRVSIDHASAELHDEERGAGSFASTCEGVRWLAEQGVALHVAGRLRWGTPEPELRAAYGALFAGLGVNIDPWDKTALMLFPEMDEHASVPEITTACWGILDKAPSSVMCASSRMIVKRKDAEQTAVLACTLLAYDEQFELGPTLGQAVGPVPLNHRHCAKFCVLGGASCS